jgi:hypothetical protein
MTTTTIQLVGERENPRDTAGAIRDIDCSYLPNRSTALLLMNEALARVRMLEASQKATVRAGASRPARLVAMLAAKRRDRV